MVTRFALLAVALMSSTALANRAKSRTIYLNPHGAVLRPGVNDARVNTSSLVEHETMVEPWHVSDGDWEEVVNCMHAMFAPFAVTITEDDPGSEVFHIEAIFTPSSEAIGVSEKTGGIAPMSTRCNVVENALVFAFTDHVHTPRRVCEVMAQEIGHAFGLDHELADADPMSYLSYSGERSFQDRTVSCGESAPRPCGVSGNVCRPDQNSFQLLLERMGEANADNDPPKMFITNPREGALLGEDFTVEVTATDPSGIGSATVFLDDQEVASGVGGLAWDISAVPGTHVVRVEVADGKGNAISRIVNFDVQQNTFFGIGCSAGSDRATLWGGFAVVGVALRRRRKRATSRA